MSKKTVASFSVTRLIASWLKAPLWKLRGCQHPAPPHLKRKVIVEIANRGDFKAFVETGTYRGDMVLEISRRTAISLIKSIELDATLAEEAQERFAKNPRVEIIKGDSGIVLESLAGSLPSPALFWLDGHYSGGVTALGQVVTPIFEELTSIGLRDQNTDVIIIDDIRLFNGHNGYPMKSELIQFISSINTSWVSTEIGDFLEIRHVGVSKKSPS